MPGPVFRGRPIWEIIVPQKTVVKNDCERCKRTWFSDECTDTAKVVVRMKNSKGGTEVEGSYDVLCDSCAKTIANLLHALVREMKKLGSSKPRAKKEGADAPSELTKSSTQTEPPAAPGPEMVSRPLVVGRHPPPSGPSKRP